MCLNLFHFSSSLSGDVSRLVTRLELSGHMRHATAPMKTWVSSDCPDSQSVVKSANVSGQTRNSCSSNITVRALVTNSGPTTDHNINIISIQAYILRRLNPKNVALKILLTHFLRRKIFKNKIFPKKFQIFNLLHIEHPP